LPSFEVIVVSLLDIFEDEKIVTQPLNIPH
jgi:hypothetical protein